MKKLLIVSFAVISLAACKGKEKKPAADLTPEQKEKAMKDVDNFTTIQWLDSVNAKLGTLVKGQTVEVSFRFKNTGTKPLIFEDVHARCGCTVPEKPEKPYAPGEEGVIRARYDGSGSGHITKYVDVVANTTPVTNFTLTFEGDIKE